MAYLKHLALVNFRNYIKAEVFFEKGMNAIHGDNGQGKTNLLEAIYLLSTGRSFRTSSFQELMHHGEPFFYLEATFVKDEVEQKLKLHVTAKDKQLIHNQTRFNSFNPLLGLLPSTIYSPSDIYLIAGAPVERRRFLNLHIAQTDPLYVYYLQRYQKALDQRNALLKQRKLASIEVWEAEMAKAALYLMQKRSQLLQLLSLQTQEEYLQLSQEPDPVSLIYKPSISPHIEDLARMWKNQHERELQMGYTLNGPHRDDFAILLREKSADTFGSEGQKRTIIASIKLAECRQFDHPLFSIDDFAVHLDNARTELFLSRLHSVGQLFITSPHKIPSPHQPIYIERGQICHHSF